MMVNNKNTTLMGTVNGTMASQGRPERVRSVTTKRHFLSEVARTYDSEQVLSTSQSPYQLGSAFANGTVLFAASDLGPNAESWIKSYDKYRITDVEVFATLTTRLRGSVERNIPVEVYFYEDTDADTATSSSWIRCRDRRNLGKVVLNALTPSQRIAKFKPTPSFNANEATVQSPSNTIPSKNIWMDALAINQKYSGLRFFAACPTADAQGQTYDFTISLMTKYTIEATQPL